MFILQHSKINCVAFIQAVNYSFSHSLTHSSADSMGHGGTCPHLYK